MTLHPIKPIYVGIDLGTANTIIMDKERVRLQEPSIIAFRSSDTSLVAVGQQAMAMHEKTPAFFKTIKPLKDGVIADFSSAQQMLRGFVEKTTLTKNRFGKKIFLICIPYDTTEVEKRAVHDSAHGAGADEVWLIFEPIAAAIGIGLDIFKPQGQMLIDIGGGTTEVAILSMASVVRNQSLRLGGNTFDKEIVEGVRRQFNLLISERMAERIKKEIGSAIHHLEENRPKKMQLTGRDLANGLPRAIEISHHEIATYLDRSLTQIERSIVKTLEQCPPELSSDIFKTGITLTGGGALLHGMVQRIQQKVQLPVRITPEPLLSVMRGIHHTLQLLPQIPPYIFK